MYRNKTPTMVIYHGPGCADGFTAAWAVWRAIGDTITEYIPCNYGDAPPDVTGHRVVVVDFSFKRDVLEDMHLKAESLTVIDHHKTSKDDLAPLLDAGIIDGVFDLEHSGARLAWNAFHTNPPPRLVRYAEDYDLWKFLLPSSKAVNAFINSYEKTFRTWSRVASTLEADIDSCAEIGHGIMRVREMQTNLIAKTASRIVIHGHEVPTANCPGFLASEVGNALCGIPILTEAETSAMIAGSAPTVTYGVNLPPFAATFYDEGETRRYSLRSRKDGGADVQAIAKALGGGGHVNAAGFSLHLKTISIMPSP